MEINKLLRRHFVKVEKIIDFKDVIAIKGSAIEEGDVIQIFDILQHEKVIYGQLKVIDPLDANNVSIDFGINISSGTMFIKGCDATIVGHCEVIKQPETTSIDIRIANLSGNITKGKILASAVVEGYAHVECNLFELLLKKINYRLRQLKFKLQKKGCSI